MGTHISLSARIARSNLMRYGLPVIAVFAAWLVSSLLNSYTGSGLGYVLLFPAVAFSAWYCGIGPSILAIVLSLFGVAYGFNPNIHALAYPNTAESVAMLAFLLASVIVVVMGETCRRESETLREAQSELEVKVRERTADLDALNRNLRDLSGRLLQMRDDERRRIARELHDSVGQMLAALSMNLSTVRNDMLQIAKAASTLTDSESLVQEMVTEVRTISHLLHPPLLDEAGLSSALRWYVDGFSQRSGIKVELDMPDDFRRFPGELETAVFRVVQESLTNIHRHSGSPTAKIRVRERDHEVMVDVEDHGKGIPDEKRQQMATSGTPGVGIRGMQERLRQLGGTLQIESDGSGTLVMARLPIEIPVGQAITVVDRSAPYAA